MIKIVGAVRGAHIDRDVDRLAILGGLYWSADIANFDSKKMPQTADGVYEGDLYVGHVLQTMLLKEAKTQLAAEGKEFAQVIEGFWFGVNARQGVHQYEHILVPGTIGAPFGSMDTYCPLLFIFGDSVSYGIECLEKTMDPAHAILLTKDQYVLVMDNK